MDNSGQPYDGKPYVVRDACPDGTVVDSRLVLYSEKEAVLYREDCKTADAPKVLRSDEFTIDQRSADIVRYNKKTFSLEKPAIPLPGVISWVYQLQGNIRPQPEASIFIIDMFDSSAQKIESLKQSGHTVICAITAGTVEDWRPDAKEFRSQDIGNTVKGTSKERWLDTRSNHVRSLMLKRLDLAREKGCHGVGFDSVDAYKNNTGFSLSTRTQLEYNTFLAHGAHDRDLILSLNNAPELAHQLANVFDFAIAEQCFQYRECHKYQSFIDRNKPVLVAEYRAYSSTQCREAEESKLSLVYLSSRLDGSRFETCQ